MFWGLIYQPAALMGAGHYFPEQHLAVAVQVNCDFGELLMEFAIAFALPVFHASPMHR